MQYTPNYGLSLYQPNDTTAFMTSYGWNGSMTKIDESMSQIQVETTKNSTDIAALESQVSGDHDEINNVTVELSDLTEKVTGNTANIAGLGQRMTTAETNIQTLQNDMANVGVVYRSVLSANETTLAITIGDFTDNSLVDVYSSKYGLAPTNVELRPATGGQPNICVTTWPAQSNDLLVAVIIRD